MVKNAGSHFLLSELPEWAPFPAVLKGKIRLRGSTATNPVAVGDVVDYEARIPDGASADAIDLGNPALICAVRDRKNHVIRKSTNLSRQSHVIAANIDMAYIVISLYFPEIKLPFLDRILVTCEVYGIPVTIVMNKTDLYRAEAQEQINRFRDIYEAAGYRVLETSVMTGEGVGELREEIAGKVCLFSGESGVGKSSLIKAIDPSLDPKVGRISDVHLQGMHTTSLYEMYRVGSGGYIIDTPGIKGFGTFDIEREELTSYFKEIFHFSKDCRFNNCTHTHEPGCAVLKALEEHYIAESRYQSYLSMMDDTEEGKYRS